MDRRGSFGVKRPRSDDGTATIEETVPKRSDSRADDASELAETAPSHLGGDGNLPENGVPASPSSAAAADSAGICNEASTIACHSENHAQDSSTPGATSLSDTLSATAVFSSALPHLTHVIQSSRAHDAGSFESVNADTLVSRLCEALIAGNVQLLASSMGECFRRICGSDHARFSVWLSNDVDALVTAIPHAFTQFTPGHIACAALLCGLGFPLPSFIKVTGTPPPLQFLMLLHGYGLDLDAYLTPAFAARDVPLIVWLAHRGAFEHMGTTNLFRRHVEQLVEENRAKKAAETTIRIPRSVVHPAFVSAHSLPAHVLENLDEDMISNDWEEVPGSGHVDDDQVVDIAYDVSVPSPVQDRPGDDSSGFWSTSSPSSGSDNGDTLTVPQSNLQQPVAAVPTIPPVPRLEPSDPAQLTSPDTPHRVSAESNALREYLAVVSALSPDAENTPRTRSRQIAREVVRTVATNAITQPSQDTAQPVGPNHRSSERTHPMFDDFLTFEDPTPANSDPPVPRVVGRFEISDTFGGAKERRLASTVRDLSSHVTVLEMNLRWSAMERFWGADNGAVRNVWRTTLRGASKPEHIATSVRELENALKWDSMLPDWAGVRREWVQQIERPNSTVSSIASCILTLISNMKRTSFIHVFKFDEFVAKLRGLISDKPGTASEMSPELQNAVLPAPFLRCLIRTLLDHIGLRFHDCSYFRHGHVIAKEAVSLAESLASIHLHGVPFAKPESSHGHDHGIGSGRRSDDPDLYFIHALRWLYDAVPTQVLRILFSSGDPVVSDWMHDEGPNSRTKSWTEDACVESWAGYPPTPTLGPIIIDDLSSHQPMLVECLAMLIMRDPEPFLAGAISAAPGERAALEKSHALIRLLTLMSTGSSNLSHAAEKLLISATCLILNACHAASPNCCKCHESGTAADCKLWQCAALLLLQSNLIRNCSQGRLDGLMEEHFLGCTEAIYALYLHCGSHTPVTRRTILSLLLSLRGCKGDLPAHIAVQLLKCRRVDVDGVLMLPPPILRVAIHLWDVPMSKDHGKLLGGAMVKVLRTLLPQLFDAVGPQGPEKSIEAQRDDDLCMTNTSPSLFHDVKDVRNELGRASVFGMVLCVASYFNDLLLSSQPEVTTKQRRSSLNYHPEAPNRLRVGPVVGAPSHFDRVVEIDRMRAEVREQYMSRYAGLRRDGRMREAANDMDELLDFAFSERSPGTCTDPSHEGNGRQKDEGSTSIGDKLASFEGYKTLVAPDWFLLDLCERLEIVDTKSKEIIAVDGIEFMTVVQPVVKLMCLCPANAEYVFTRVEAGLSRHLTTATGLLASVCANVALAPSVASQYEVPTDDPEFVSLHPAEDVQTTIHTRFQAMLSLVSQHVKCTTQCLKTSRKAFTSQTSLAVCKCLHSIESVFASLGGIHRVMKSLRIADLGSKSASVALLASPIMTCVMLFTSQLWSLIFAADCDSVEDPLHDVISNAEYDAILRKAAECDLTKLSAKKQHRPMIDSESKVTESEMGVLESKDDDSDRPLAQFVPPLAPILRRFLIRACRSYLTDILVSDANATDVKFHLKFVTDSASFAVPFDAKVKWFRKRLGTMTSEPLFGRFWINESNEPRMVGPEDPLFQFGGVPQDDPLYPPPSMRTRPATRRNAMIPIRRDPPLSMAGVPPIVSPPMAPPLPPPPPLHTPSQFSVAPAGPMNAEPSLEDIGEQPVGCVSFSFSRTPSMPVMRAPQPPTPVQPPIESTDSQRSVRSDHPDEVSEEVSELARTRVRRLSLLRAERVRREASERSNMLDFDTRMPPPPSFTARNRSSRIVVHRDALFADSFERFKLSDSAVGVAQSMSVQFVGEDASGPGLVREWLHLVCSELTDPARGLFQPVGGPDSGSRFIKPAEEPACGDWQQKYAFAGRMFGIALARQQCVSAHLSTPVFALLSGHNITLRDVDPSLAGSLRYILNHDVADLHLSFPEHSSTPHADVTNTNKASYVAAQLHATLSPAVHKAVAAIREGLIEVIPPDLLKMFVGAELRALLCGPWDIDVDDWQRNTVYGNIDESSPVIKWFWEAVRSFTPKEKADLLRFVTGSPRPPLAGFTALPGGSGDVVKFQISCSYKGPESLPTAQTCFNQLKLSHRYTSYEQLRASLLLAVAHGKDRFTLM